MKCVELENWEKDFELWCDVTNVDRLSRESLKGFITILLKEKEKSDREKMLKINEVTSRYIRSYKLKKKCNS